MLRMTWVGDPAVLKLEGQLTHRLTAELRRTCAKAANGRLGLDLSALTFADAEGLSALNELLEQGVELLEAAPLITELLRGGRR